MTESLKQKFRQPFGYYMEELIRKHFKVNGVYTIGHSHNHLYEWDETYEESNISALLEFYNSMMEFDEFNDLSTSRSITPQYPRKTDSISKEVLDGRLHRISRLVGSNTFELIRIENNKVIVSEIKSQYGPNPDYRIEIESPQLTILIKLTNVGVLTSLIYCIALPEAKFLEIPFVRLYDIFNRYSDFDGKEFKEKGYIRIRVPREYRKFTSFESMNRSLYNYNDEKTLFHSVLAQYPNKFKKLEGLID